MVSTGSLVVHPYGNKSIPAVELGASIFVDANRNLMRAAKEFNLPLADLLDDDEILGVWDGQAFVVNVRHKFTPSMSLVLTLLL